MSVRRRKVQQRVQRERQHKWTTYNYLMSRRDGLLAAIDYFRKKHPERAAEADAIESRVAMPTKPICPEPKP